MSFCLGLRLRSSMRSNQLRPSNPAILATWQEGACLEVSAYFALTGCALCAVARIIAGKNVAVGADTTIVDIDFDPVDAEQRRLKPSEARTA